MTPACAVTCVDGIRQGPTMCANKQRRFANLVDGKARRTIWETKNSTMSAPLDLSLGWFMSPIAMLYGTYNL